MEKEIFSEFVSYMLEIVCFLQRTQRKNFWSCYFRRFYFLSFSWKL